MERIELFLALRARPVNRSVYQVGRAWVARHGMSTYKDTTPQISFRTGPPSSKHKDGRPSRSVPSLFSCLCRRGTPVTARACKRIRTLRWVAPCIPRSSSVGEPKRALGRAIHLNLRLPACYSTSCRSRCHVSQVRHQHYDRSPGTNAICRAASASPTSPMRSVAAPRVKLSSLIVSVDHKDLRDVESPSPGLSILDTPNQHMGIDRYRARAHEPPTPRHDMS